MIETCLDHNSYCAKGLIPPKAIILLGTDEPLTYQMLDSKKLRYMGFLEEIVNHAENIVVQL